MTVTLQDVADAVGVSRSTASRALSGSPRIAASTRAEVEAAAARLGYRINQVASALRSRQSHLIGLVLDNLTNASFHTVAAVVQRRADDQGYQVILGVTGADPRREAALLSTFASHRVDGLVIIGSGKHAARSNRMLADGVAVVNVIRAPADSAAPAVLAADREGAEQATRYLLSLGHRNIGYIGGPITTDSGSERFAGYSAALRNAGVSVQNSLIEQGRLDPAFGASAITELLRRNGDMTALFAANHEAVIGLLPALAARNLRVPDDLSLICYEDVPWLTWWHPPVTAVDNGPRELGDLAMDLIFQQIGAQPQLQAQPPPQPQPGRTYRVGARLVHRSSCRPLDGALSCRQ